MRGRQIARTAASKEVIAIPSAQERPNDSVARAPSWTGEGRGDLAAVAQGFGLKGARVNTMGRLESLFREHQEAGGTTLWDVHIDDLIPSRQFRRVRYGEP
jgi:thiamine pyrophosphate-dependent acetolactate synthase large subunit-like protein